MSRYAATGELSAVGSSYKTALILTGGTGVRPRIYDWLIGQGGTPADNAVYGLLQRATTAGTVTSVTPAPLDPADPAAEITAGENASAEPTYTASTELLELALNQRASYRWVAAPGGELIIPATASNGIGSRAKSAAYTGASGATMHWWE